jgi:hypothetical protein
MDIPHWLIVLVVLAIIAAWARSAGEIRVEQRPRPPDAEDEGPYSLAVTEAQLHGALEEMPRSRIEELKKARDTVQRQIEILATEMHPTQETRKLIEQLRATLSELDARFAAETNPDQH